MKPPLIWIAVVSGVLLTACASKPSMPPMATTCTVPLECALSCQEPPPPTLPRELWDIEILSWASGCARLHSDCVEALTRE